MAGLSRSLDRLKDRYDVIVVGSGYGGGVAASRLARAGKRVAVLERGREVLTGGFPSRFSDLKNELQVTGKRMQTGPSSALYDVRLGEDMHVLVGCGLGGGSLVNAGVALKPDDRVFADEVWPGQIAQDGLLAEGFRRAQRWLNPQSDPSAATYTKFKALAAAGRGLGPAPIAPPITVTFDATVNRAGVAQPACTRCGDCCGGCNVGAKTSVALTYLADAARHGAELFTHAGVRHIAKAGDGSWTVHVRRMDKNGTAPAEITIHAPVVLLGAGTLGTSEILLRSRSLGLALSDRVGERFSANGDIIAFGYGATSPVDAVGIGHPPKLEGVEIGAAVSGQIEFDDEYDLARELRVQEGVLPSALAPVLPVLFIPNGRLLGALQSLISGVYQGPVLAPADLLRRVARQRIGPLRPRRRPPHASVARRQGRAGLRAARCSALLDRAAGGRLLRQEPARGYRDGPSAGDRASAGWRRHGSRARQRRGQPQMPGVRRCAWARLHSRARGALRGRRRGDAAFARCQSSADHHGACRACDAAHGAGLWPVV